MSNAAADTFIIFCLLATAGLILTVASWLFKYVFGDKPIERPAPRDHWLDRQLTRDEAAFLCKHINIYDCTGLGLGPKHYHDVMLASEIEGHIMRDTGRDFALSMSDWAEIMRAWYVTRGAPQGERVAALKHRLITNI
tara:strand:+ start:48 stop:461 length:414 start_codon:yes stop_codon:yes gene_type:complete